MLNKRGSWWLPTFEISTIFWCGAFHLLPKEWVFLFNRDISQNDAYSFSILEIVTFCKRFSNQVWFVEKQRNTYIFLSSRLFRSLLCGSPLGPHFITLVINNKSQKSITKSAHSQSKARISGACIKYCNY